MNPIRATLTAFCLLLPLLTTSPFTIAAPVSADETLSGGRGTHLKRPDRHAFSQPARNMPFEQQLDFRLGQGIFKKLWVAAPTATTASDGLGPVYNARSCLRCHINNGRGHPPEADWPTDNAVSMLLRLSIAAPTAEAQAAAATKPPGVIPEPTYGTQLQDFAVAGLAAEGRLQIRYTEIPVALSEGETASLRQPRYSISETGYDPLHPDLRLSPRIAPPMIGLGLLEAISDQQLLSAEDPHDQDGDGISGRANRVWDTASQQLALGRFGWKAGHSSLAQQNNAALNTDIGISNADYPNPYGDCTARQTDCLARPHGNSEQHDGLEASRTMTDLLLLYTRNLAVPARRNAEQAEVQAGQATFHAVGCAQCHTPQFTIDRDPAESHNRVTQRIWPYSDLLLHDMGEGLADHRTEYAADGHEWRTPPLWGIGLTQTVNGHSFFLHDGRARNLLEAILWHGGEAEAAKQAVIRMPRAERHNLIRFLESL